MRNLFIFLVVSLFSFSLLVNEASAKRFGGGRSFGVQRSSSSYSSASSKPAAAMGQRSGMSKWGGVLGGLVMGSLLASLFMGNGFASGIMSWLLVGGLIFLLISVFRKKMQPQAAANGPYAMHSGGVQDIKRKFDDIFQPNNGGRSSSVSSTAFSDGFNEDEFLRDSKVKFMRLQAAYDQKNLGDLRAFTSVEVLAEIQMQFQEREEDDNKTEVMTLEAELLDAPSEDNLQTASVRFTGLIKEDNNQPENVNEVWHFRKEAGKEGWQVCGLQQHSIYH